MDRPPHLDIDLNEAPSPQQCETPPPRGFAPPVYAPPPLPQFQPPPPQPAPASQQLLLQQEALEMALQFHRVPEPRNTHFGAIGNVPSGFLPGLGVPPPPPHPGEAGWGHPPRLCASCGHPEILGGTMVCDACDRGFHPSCVRVWPPLMLTPPPPPGPPGARRPRAAANDDWICPECEMRGARSSRWKLGPVPLDINAAPPEDAVMDISRQLLQLSLTR